jgi:hypothetical protein
MAEIIFVVEEAPEGGFTACAVGAASITGADSVPEPRESVRDAVRRHLDNGQEPEIVLLHFPRGEVIPA